LQNYEAGRKSQKRVHAGHGQETIWEIPIMNNHIKCLFLVPALIFALGLMLADRATAQTFTTLHSFSSLDANSENSDGAVPLDGPIISGNILYGTAQQGGSFGVGTIFSFNMASMVFSNLYNFSSTANNAGDYPVAGLIISGNTLYGMARGGANGTGAIFDLNTNGVVTGLHSFSASTTNTWFSGSAAGVENSDGAYSFAGVILSGNALYGTTYTGGTNGTGTIFALNTNNMVLTVLHTFGAPAASYTTGPLTNSDGDWSAAGLVISGNTLYGTTSQGNFTGLGTVFAINTSGSGFRIVYAFTNYNDGALPNAVIVSGNTLYGTAGFGPHGGGTVFAVNTDGTAFTNLYSFTETQVGLNYYAVEPAGLVLSGSTLYGTTYLGPDGTGNGTVFAVNTNGTGFTNLYVFTGGSDGSHPNRGLILSGNTLYGTTYSGGVNGNGTLFSLSLGGVSAPLLTIRPSGTNVILTWPTNATGFILESATNLASSAVWITNTSAPVVVGTNNAVTNGFSGSRKFYRLISQ
jgi:uncharacterized repeat protein (TIGR03803 family)